MGFAEMAIDELQRRLRDAKKQLAFYEAMEKRLNTAYNDLKPHKENFDHQKSKVGKIADENSNWKGETREQYEDDIEFLLKEMKARQDKLNDYLNAVWKAESKARMRAGHYIPIVTEIKSLLTH